MSAETIMCTMMALQAANLHLHGASMLQNLLRLIQAGEPASVVMACNVFQVRQLGQLWWLVACLGSTAAACHARRRLARQIAAAHLPPSVGKAGA